MPVMLRRQRSARFRTVTRKVAAANDTDALLLAAPGAGRRWVLDFLYFNISVAGTFEIKFGAAGAWSNYDSEASEGDGTQTAGAGGVGGSFGANGGFVTVSGIECPVNKEIRLTTTGTTPTHYTVITAHVEMGS